MTFEEAVEYFTTLYAGQPRSYRVEAWDALARKIAEQEARLDRLQDRFEFVTTNNGIWDGT